MYWIRSGNLLNLVLFVVCAGLFWAGGWLLAVHVFRLRRRERLVAGLALGWVLFIVLANLLAHVLPLTVAFWGASLLVFAGGLAAALRAPAGARFPWGDLQAWPQAALLAAGTLVLALVGRGLSIFDDYLHLPLVSSMASGDIPPHFYLNPDNRLAYHYGLQVFAAALVRLAGMFPWSAWDLSKAFAIALTPALAWLWFRRVTRSAWAAALGSALVALGSGARWLLLLLPPAWLEWVSGGIQLINTGADSGANLAQVLSNPWVIEGGGPTPFPFVFHNSILAPSIMSLGASGALPTVTLILLLILAAERKLTGAGAFLVSLVFAGLALSAEHIFVFLWGGIALAGLIYFVLRRDRARPGWRGWLPHGRLGTVALHWLIILAVAAVLSVTQGAFLTEALHTILEKIRGTHVVQGEFDYFTFGPQWPPALVSGHLGVLSLFDPRHLVVLLAELGPALLLAPFATVYAWRQMLRRDWMAAGLGFAALVSFIFPLFFLYGVPRSSTRLPAFALWAWLLVGFPPAWAYFQKARRLPRLALGLSYGSAMLAGVALLAIQLIAIPYPQLSYYITQADGEMSNAWWDRLPQGSQVLDQIPHRAVAVFGRATKAQADFYNPLPEWGPLTDNPEPSAVARAGYDYLYMDRAWWQRLTPELRKAYKQDCVVRTAEIYPDERDFRWLLDVSRCR